MGTVRKSLTLLLITVAVSFGAIQAEAEKAKVYRVGVLLVGTEDYPTLKGLRDGLKDAGYLEGKNLFLEIALKKTYDELRPIAKAYREKKFDVVMTIGETATAIAKEETQGIPIVFMHGIDPLGSGFVKSLAHPGTNITGLMSYPGLEMQAKRLEVFKSLVPTLRRVVVLYNAREDAPHHVANLAVTRKAARSLGLTLSEKPIHSAVQAERALSALSKETTDGVFMICSGLFRPSFKKISAIAWQKRLPLNACNIAELTEHGGLWLYAADVYQLGRRGAWYVDRILKGTKPQELPVETPTKFEFIINLKTAKEIGLIIPPEVLIRADQVIR